MSCTCSNADQVERRQVRRLRRLQRQALALRRDARLFAEDPTRWREELLLKAFVELVEGLSKTLEFSDEEVNDDQEQG
jgi:hypothetical protein